MNERIQKLAVEAFFDESTNVFTDKMYTFGEEKMQKFAELIVRECAQIADTAEPYQTSDLILKHFGVEE